MKGFSGEEMSRVKVSVIIPTFNSARTIENCVSSIRENSSQHAYEVIIADAGSVDETLEIARPYVDRVLTGKPGRINRNIGVETAQGEIVCFTDSDCIVPTDWIDKLVDGLVRLHRGDKMVVGVGGGSVLHLENPSPMEFAVIKAMNSPLVSFKARNLAVYKEEREVLHNPPMNSAYFKWAVEKVGGFQEEYGYGAEDLELDAKLTDQGYRLYYLPEVTIWHEHWAGFKKFIRQMYKLGIGRVRVGRKFKKYFQFHHYGPIFLCLMTFSPLLFIPLGMALLNGIYVSLKERNLCLFPFIVLLTASFYVAYGLGEIAEFLKGNK